MLIDIAFGSKAVWRILILLAGAPGKSLSRSEIREHSKLGNNPLSLSLRTLKKFKIINEKKIGKSLYYNLDLTNEFVSDILRVIEDERKNLNNLPYRFSLILRELTRKLIDTIEVEKVFLFGSVAKRIYREDSDIDIAVVGKFNAGEKLRVAEFLEEIEDRFKKKIQIHYFTEKEFTKKDKLVMEILRDGVELL